MGSILKNQHRDVEWYKTTNKEYRQLDICNAIEQRLNEQKAANARFEMEIRDLLHLMETCI